MNKNRNLYKLIFGIFLITSGLNSFAQPDSMASDSSNYVTDPEMLSLPFDSLDRGPNQENDQHKIEPIWTDDNWSKAKDGIEYNKKEKEKEKEDTQNKTYDSFNLSNWFSEVFTSKLAKMICISLIFLALVFIIHKLLAARVTEGDKKIPLANQLDEIDFNNINEETDMQRFLRAAMDAGDHKSAVRILYLTIIQELNQMHWIKWKKEKTNHDYLNEMRSRSNYKQFRELTLVYEVVWYGDRNITLAEFEKLNGAFKQFKNTLTPENE